jgi:hypothetical protein
MFFSLQFIMIGRSFFDPAFLLSLRKTKSMMQFPERALALYRNLSTPSKRDDEPAHIKIAATKSSNFYPFLP